MTRNALPARPYHGPQGPCYCARCIVAQAAARSAASRKAYAASRMAGRFARKARAPYMPALGRMWYTVRAALARRAKAKAWAAYYAVPY